MNHWLMKSEPSCFSIDDLNNAPLKTTSWDGVRNYQARNFMLKDMRLGDRVFFYHSNTKEPGIVGIAEVCSHAYPDHTAFDPDSEHPDPQSSLDKPRWFMVDVRFVEKFSKPISLQELKRHPELDKLLILRKGNRLSIVPIAINEWDFIVHLATQPQ